MKAINSSAATLLTLENTGMIKAMMIILIGIALIVMAAAGIYAGYSSHDWVIAGIAWAIMIIGTLITLFGFGKRISDRAEPNPTSAQHGRTEIRALVQSMGVVAVADHKVRDQEIEAIARIHDQMLGLKITHDEIHEILAEFEGGFDITERLTRDRAQISPMMKRLIVQSCHLVMVSDLEVVRPEENKVQEVGKALGFDQTEIDDLIATAST